MDQLRINGFWVTIMLLVYVSSAAVAQRKPGKVLVFSKTEGGYRHASIEAGKEMFIAMAKQKKFIADTTEDAAVFTIDRLKQYDVIVFLSTRGNILDSLQQIALQEFIHLRKGFIGIHAATTTEYEWPWYNKLIGAYFDGHPEPQSAHYRKADKNFYPLRDFPDTLTWMDEVYNFKSVQDSLHYVITVDEKSYEGGKMGAVHPVSWYHYFEGSRVFYISLGHFDSAYTDPMFTQIIYRGLEWAVSGH
ncbi:MAG: Crp/Fnr family transcriptional regulator [Citrobacter freundii]|nr:MAG: Crp/Fnr family transcriptional regulator [Citrobacter freundii]